MNRMEGALGARVLESADAASGREAREVCEAPWGVYRVYPVYRVARIVAIAGLLATVAMKLGHLALFWWCAPVMEGLAAIGTWSGSLLQPTLTGNWMLAPVLFALWLGVLGLRPRDVGLVRARVGAGLCVLVGGWLAIQLARAVAAVIAGDGLAWSAPIAAGRGGWLFGAVVAQVLGTGLVEEVLYRGMLLPQLFARLRGGSERRRLLRAVLIDAAFFTVCHVPMLLDRGLGASEIAVQLVWLAIFGCYFAALYLRTGNLFVVMAIHALSNVSGDVIASPLLGPRLAELIGLACIVWWPRPRRARGSHEGC